MAPKAPKTVSEAISPETVGGDGSGPLQPSERVLVERLDLFRTHGPVADVSQIPEAVAEAVYQLRVSGQSEEAIAKTSRLSLEQVTAVVALRADLRRQREARTLGIDAMLEIDRLDQMLEAIWPTVLSGDLYAIDRALKIGAERRALKGLDAPTIKATINATVSDTDLDYSKYSPDELKALAALLAKGRRGG